MTDTERVLKIIQEKKLTNNQFCSMTGISPASLSHITSGKTNPSLSTLRSIIAGFPDLSPMWVLQGEGEMYRNPEATASSPTAAGGEVEFPERSAVGSASPMVSKSNDLFGGDGFADAFSFKPNFSSQNPKTAPRVGASVVQSPQGGAASPVDLAKMDGALRTNDGGIAHIQALAEATAAAAVRHYQRPQRKIIEVRIFFDDGTYESFGGPK